MANLIITIIAIALVAVLALAGIWYGGSAFTNSKTQARANALMNEVRQIYGMATQYGLNNAIYNFGVDYSLQTALSSFNVTLPIAGIPAVFAGGSEAATCARMDDEVVYLERSICQINGKNVVNIHMHDQPTSGCATANDSNAAASAAASADLPVVKLAKAINDKLGLPPGVTLAASGLPYAIDGVSTNCTTRPGGVGIWSAQYMNGSEKFNYCYLRGTSGSSNSIICTFTGL